MNSVPRIRTDHLMAVRGEDDIRSAIRSLCRGFDLEYWDECDRTHTFPTEFYSEFAKAGWFRMLVAEEDGGDGATLSQICAVLEELAASGGGINACSSVHLTMISMTAVARHASDALKAQVLPRLLDGGLIISFGVTEPDAGTDTARITSSMRPSGSGYVVDARKTWNSGAQEAEMCLLLVRDTPYDPTMRMSGMTLLLVDLDSPQVAIHPIRKIGRNAVDSNDLRIDDLEVPGDRVVGTLGRGFYHLLDGLNSERVMLAAEAIGMGRWMLDRAATYAAERVVFDRPIGQNQAVQHPLATSFVELTAAAGLVREAALVADRGGSQRECGELANMAKFAATEAAFRAADAAMQVHGGYAFASEFHIGRHWIESRLQRIAPINNQMILNFVAESMLALPRSY